MYILMDLLLPAINLLLRKNNISFALSSVPLKRVKMDLSLSLGTLMRAEKEQKKNHKKYVLRVDIRLHHLQYS